MTNITLLPKTLIIILAAIPLMFLLAETPHAYAIMVDGDLSDWGVTPFSHWESTSRTAWYSIENGTARQYSDLNRVWNESFDIKAMYFDSSPANLYFAVVTSNTFFCDWAREYVAMDFTGRTYNQIMTNGEGHGYYNGPAWNYSRRDNYYYQYAVDINGIPGSNGARAVYQANGWYGEYWGGSQNAGVWFPTSMGPSAVEGTRIGYYQVAKTTGQYINPLYPSLPVYVIEGSIPRSYFGNPPDGSPVELYLDRVTCVKDWITVRGYINSPNPALVPEPGSLFLLGFGLLGARTILSRKKKPKPFCTVR